MVYRRLMERLPVRTPRRTVVPMRFNEAQEALHASIAPDLDVGRPIRRIVLKARRLGMSTWIENFLTCLCVLQNYSQVMVVAHEAPATERIWQMSRGFVEGSPLRAIARITGHRIQFRHSTIELATAGSPNATRGADLTACHLSEVAYWKQSAAMLAILQCLPREEDVFSAAFIESTANGMTDDGALFYEEWQKAARGEGSFVPLFLPWHLFPQYTSRDERPLDNVTTEETQYQQDLGLTWGQMRWRRRVIVDECQDSPDKFNQEYPATPEMAFIMSGLPFFSVQDLLWFEPHVQRGRRGRLVERGARVVFQDDSAGLLTVFRAPEPGHEYIVGADSAMGYNDGRHSRSAAEVLDMDTLEQVAEYEGPSPPHTFARDLALLGRAYNEALLFPEVQSSGGGGGRELIVYLRDTYSYPSLGGWKGSNDRIRAITPTLYGWETTSRTKPQMLARMQEVIDERSALIHSRALLTQLRTFGEKDSGVIEALAGHDDLLMAWGIAIMGRFQNHIPRTSMAQIALQFPFKQANMASQEEIHDRDAAMLARVMGVQVGAVPEDGLQPAIDFLLW
jgi:hypothetical protein